ncbi:hypothetical protein CTL2C_923 [Chlamydia trachomatis L2c]|nr:hypothetical protein CTL2C_923 [Chlamydia trachomatis L2c]
MSFSVIPDANFSSCSQEEAFFFILFFVGYLAGSTLALFLNLYVELL